MDWTRPPKVQGQQTGAPPLYLTHPETPYCRTCGRVIGSRRSNNASKSNEVKYCSERCKRNKPTSDLDKKIEATLRQMLLGLEPSLDGQDDQPRKKPTSRKGDARIVLRMSEIEEVVFGERNDPARSFGRKRNRARRGVADGEEWTSVDMDDGFLPGGEGSKDLGDVLGVSVDVEEDDSDDFDGGVGLGEHGIARRSSDGAAKFVETPEMLLKRREGQKKAEEREQVRQAARRAIVFGLEVPRTDSTEPPKKKSNRKADRQLDDDNDETSTIFRKCEAIMNGMVVDPSFAKGDWEIRWRED